MELALQDGGPRRKLTGGKAQRAGRGANGQRHPPPKCRIVESQVLPVAGRDASLIAWRSSIGWPSFSLVTAGDSYRYTEKIHDGGRLETTVVSTCAPAEG